MTPAASPQDRPQPAPRVADRLFELFSKPLRVALLAELVSGPGTRSDLLAKLGAPPSTFDALLNELDEADLIVRERSNEFPTQTTVSLARGAGEDLAPALEHVAGWLNRAGLGTLQAQDPKTIRIASLLSWSWHHRVVDLLAVGPISVTRLIAQSEGASASAIQAHLRDLVAFGIVEVTRQSPSRTNLYALSRLGHDLVGSLAAFVRWELRHHPGTAARLTKRDVATAIRMACSLVDPGQMRPGRYAFVVNLADGSPAGLVVDFAPDTWRTIVNATGRVRYGVRADPLPWLDAILDLKIRHNATDPAERLTILPSDCDFIELVHDAISHP